MFLISVGAEYKYEIKKMLKTNNFKNIEIFAEDDINDRNKYHRYKYIITDYNKEIIEYFTNLGKTIIIVDKNINKRKKEYASNKNIIIVEDASDVVYSLKTECINKKKIIETSQIIKALTIIILIVGICLIQNNNLLKSNNIKNKNIEEKSNIIKKNKDFSKKEKNYSKENYLFLGDSITDFYDLKKYYGNLPVVNSGTSGNQYKDLLYNLEERVYKYNPTKVFLLIGTNDMAFTDITNEELVDRIMEICDEIHKHREETEIYVESIYPVNRKTDNDVVNLNMVLERYNDRIQEINKLLKEKVDASDYTYIDMYSKLEDEEGNLKVEYTVDGLHMSDEGYKVITSEIKKIIEN